MMKGEIQKTWPASNLPLHDKRQPGYDVYHYNQALLLAYSSIAFE
jgi:hypothetical protein